MSAQDQATAETPTGAASPPVFTPGLVGALVISLLLLAVLLTTKVYEVNPTVSGTVAGKSYDAADEHPFTGHFVAGTWWPQGLLDDPDHWYLELDTTGAGETTVEVTRDAYDALEVGDRFDPADWRP